MKYLQECKVQRNRGKNLLQRNVNKIKILYKVLLLYGGENGVMADRWTKKKTVDMKNIRR